MRNAYNMFFDNDFESIETQEIIDQFTSSKFVDPEYVKQVIHDIDVDNSNSISAAEFFEKMCDLLDSKQFDCDICTLISSLKWPRDADNNINSSLKLPINQNGSFDNYKFDYNNYQVTLKH